MSFPWSNMTPEEYDVEFPSTPARAAAPVSTATVDETRLRAHGRELVTGLIDAMAPAIKQIDVLRNEVATLSARVLELEASSMKYCGVHQASLAYRKGDVVTHDGSAWCATRSVSAERPGSSDGWQLMVKHGRDAPGTSSPRSDATATSSQRNGHSGVPANPRMR